MTWVLMLTALVCGAGLAQFFRVIILVPATLALMFLTVACQVHDCASLLCVVASTVAAIFCLHGGYVAGALAAAARNTTRDGNRDTIDFP